MNKKEKCMPGLFPDVMVNSSIKAGNITINISNSFNEYNGGGTIDLYRVLIAVYDAMNADGVNVSATDQLRILRAVRGDLEQNEIGKTNKTTVKSKKN